MEKRLVAKINLKTLEVDYDQNFRFRCVEECGRCCESLEIPLRDEDIEKIEELGYNAWEFVDYEKLFYRRDKFLGYGIKKNPVTEACVFLDPETKKCKIYPHRPLACRLYPFIFVRSESYIEVYVKEDDFCPGINHPDGLPVDRKFLLSNYGDVVREYRKKTVKETE